jgi:hypothetical protein
MRQAIEDHISLREWMCPIPVVRAMQSNEFQYRLSAKFICHEVPGNKAPRRTLAIFLLLTQQTAQKVLGAFQNVTQRIYVCP